MDLEKERLKINCNYCKKDFILTFNTTHCPSCEGQFSSEEVHQVFYNYESRVANSKLHQFSEKMQKSGENMEKTGNALSQLGCFFIMLPLGMLCLWFLITMFK